jgi:hypothetical protein
MAARKPLPLDDDADEGEGEGEEVLNDIASSGAGQGQRTNDQQTQRTNGHADDVEIIFDNGEGDDQGDGGDDQDERPDARLTEDEQPSASYLDQQQLHSKNTRRREGRERTRGEAALLRAKLAASDGRMAEMEGQIARLTQFAGRVEPQLAQFSESQLQNKLAGVDANIAKADGDLEAAEKAITTALTDNDSEALVKSMRVRDKAFIASEKLRNEKIQLTTAIAASAKDKERGTGGNAEDQRARGGNGQGGQGDNQPLPAKASAFMREFTSRFPWFNKNASDKRDLRDTKIVSMLDDEVMQERFDPNDPTYWRELESRMRDAVPHRFDRQIERKDSYAQPRERQEQRQPARNEQRRGPPTSAPGTGGRSGGKMIVRLTPQRREALEQAGVIDAAGRPIDSKKFESIARQYAEIDRANGAGQ